MVFSYFLSQIDAQVSFHDHVVWRFTGFYGCPVTSKQYMSCALLESLRGSCNLALCWGFQ